MELDTDFLETNRNAKIIRRRVRLSFLALLACIIMMANLISKANAHQPTASTASNSGEHVMCER